MKPYITIN
jgi:hypothetical protein